MKPPPIQWIPVFEASARFKSFKKAAEFLNVSPSAVSQQIKHLEDFLGIKLFKRMGPRLDLTTEGEFYSLRAQSVVSAHEIGFKELDRKFNNRSLLLNTPLFIAQELLIPNYYGYKAIEPMAELRITSGSEYIDFDLGTSDAAIRFGNGKWPGLLTKKLCDISVGLIKSPRYKNSQLPDLKNFISKETLEQHVLVTTKEDLSDWKLMFKEINPVDVVVCDSYFSVINSVEKGLGIGLGLFPAINRWVKDNKLQILNNKIYATNYAYWLVYPSHQETNNLIASCYLWSKSLFDDLQNVKLEDITLSTTNQT